jgi:hypothetical protein
MNPVRSFLFISVFFLQLIFSSRDLSAVPEIHSALGLTHSLMTVVAWQD